MMTCINSLVAKFTVEEWTKIITACVALVAVIVGPFLQWRIARRQAADNISSKRQNWIDELRKDSAEFLQLLARLEELQRPNPNLFTEDKKLVFDEKALASARANELGIRIKLRLNPNESNHKKLVELFGILHATLKEPSQDESDIQKAAAKKEFMVARDKIIDHLQIILKFEWDRVKKGG